MTDEPDDLEAILAPVNASLSPTLRESLFQRTDVVQFRRRMVIRLGKACTLAAVLLLGIGIGRLRDERPTTRDALLFREPARIVVPVLILLPVPAEAPTSSPPPIASAEPATAAQAELLAEQTDDRGEAARLYRLAGDRYLNDLQDYRNATRCYRLHLARAGDPALTPTAADSWLLTSLKNAAFKEKFNVAKTDG